ncbi:PDDEXK nuclease domain-containing protein [Sphingobacterium sp. SRCM116780]|uniref:PDDEXK nuclease domain-containing protein n=1 Tax=Sphingobacterium sp. SRCM116780 TaxID=2907623 RepID=UPI0039802D41
MWRCVSWKSDCHDPYFLDLSDMYSEKDFETSIIVELQYFIVELRSDFAFMARQKHINIDNRDYYIKLLFYHRRLNMEPVKVSIWELLGRYLIFFKFTRSHPIF